MKTIPRLKNFLHDLTTGFGIIYLFAIIILAEFVDSGEIKPLIYGFIVFVPQIIAVIYAFIYRLRNPRQTQGG